MMRREMLVLIAASMALFFGTATTFSSMGIALFAMVGEFHWSEAAAGGAFLALGLICAASSLSPILLIPRIGGRWTMAGGSLILAAGLGLAYTTQTLMIFYVAAALFGLAFSMIANATGTYLIASWYGARSPRMIGIYMMIGTLGGAVGPPVAGALVATEGGWRLYWLAMAGVAVVIAALCAVCIREPPGQAMASGEMAPPETWQFRAFLRTPQFAVVAAAMVATQACTIMVSAVAAPHLAQLGWSDSFAAQLLGLHGLVGTAATGVSGWLSERRDPRKLLAAALVAETLGIILIAFTHSLWTAYAFVVVFGIGWSVASLAGTVLLFRYFGNATGTAALSTVWLLAGVATASPYVAGKVDDLTGSFVPALVILGLALLPIALAALAMSAMRRVSPAA
jgi:MFS family permease